MKTVVIVHGYTGNPEINWFPWLKEQLESQGVRVLVPAMPEPDEPQLDVWLETLNSLDIGPHKTCTWRVIVSAARQFFIIWSSGRSVM